MTRFPPRQLQKIQQLREAGVEPWPVGRPVPDRVVDVLEAGGDRPAEELEADPRVFEVAGRLRFKREMGRAGFGVIEDPTGEVQLWVRKDVLGPEGFRLWRWLDLGDHVRARGRLGRTRRGELSLVPDRLELYAKCIASLPDKHKGFTDPEMRQRMRYLDLIMNPETRRVFTIRSLMVRAIRRFFDDRGFLEVETPMMHVIPGGAAARPFVTHHNALDLDLYLRVAPELFLKRLVVGGFHRVYELNRNFRNEGISTRHNPEFTMVEWYQAHSTFHDLMDLTEELIPSVAREVLGTTVLTLPDGPLDLGPPWRRARMDELVAEATGLDDPWDVAAMRERWLADHPDDDPEELPTTPGAWLEWAFEEWVEPGLRAPTFVTHHPAEISPLARRTDGEPRVTDRFELIVAGSEIANGFTENNDPIDQAERLAAQAAARAQGDDEAMFFDEDFVRALSYGMPPTAGEGLGIDRLAMLLTGRTSIREVILFPTLRPLREGDPLEPGSPDEEG